MLGNKKIIVIQLLLLMHLFSQKTDAQEHSIKNYSTSAGMPSSELYRVIQDKKGYIWFATDNGISRFDGLRFTNFDMKDGLVNNTVFDLYEDYKGRIWFIALSGNLCYYENQKIVTYKYNNVLSNALGVRAIPTKRAFYTDSLDNVYVSIGHYGLLKITADGKLSNLTKQSDNEQIGIDSIKGSNFLVSYKVGASGKTNICILGQNYPFNFGLSLKRSSLLFANKGDSKNKIVFSIDNTIFSYSDHKIKKLKQFDDEIIWFSRDKENNYWVSIRNYGVKLFKNSDFSTPQATFLENEDVSSVLVDNENGTWFTTLDNGTYYLPNMEIKTIDIEGISNKNVYSISISPTRIFAGVDEKNLLVFSKRDMHEEFRLKFPPQYSPINLAYHPVMDKIISGTYNSCIAFDYRSDKKNIGNFNKIDKKSSSDKAIKSLRIGKGNYFWAGTYTGLYKFTENEIVYQSNFEDKWTQTVSAIYENNDGSLWIGTYTGLWRYENGKYSYFGDKNEILSHRIDALYKTGNTLCIGTKGMGLVLLDTDSMKTAAINTSNGLASNSISDIVAHNNDIWIGTNKGINCLSCNGKNLNISRLDIGSGLIDNEINQLAIDDSILYIATRKGINFLNLNKHKWTKEKPLLYIQQLKINNKDTALLPDLELRYNQNNININYIAISYKSSDNIRYKYQLSPIEQEWQETRFHEINYANLASGKYTFKVKAMNESGVWSDVNETLNFTIDKPFWEKWWFYVLPVIVIILFILLILQNSLYKIRKENSIRKELKSSTQKLIAAQINPHFIFNSFNSIHHAILKSDKAESSRYLSKLSNYIRGVLDAVQQDFLTLSDEINTINLYLELEKFRLKDKLNYELYIDPELVLKEIVIPGLFIQPLLEKAIWNRLKPLKESGFVKIAVCKNKENIEVTIEDNGIFDENNNKGIDKEFISKRVQLLNELYKGQIKFDFTPNTMVSFNQTGNKVHLLLQLKPTQIINLRKH